MTSTRVSSRARGTADRVVSDPSPVQLTTRLCLQYGKREAHVASGGPGAVIVWRRTDLGGDPIWGAMKRAGTVTTAVAALAVPAPAASAAVSSGQLDVVKANVTEADCRAMTRLVSRPAVKQLMLQSCRQHVTNLKLRWCGQLKWGPRKEQWRVRNACRIRVTWPSSRLQDRRDAVRVAFCEGSFAPNAKNGQYLGTFQMGTNERATYGHAGTIVGQVAAAARYWKIAGWGPWQCRPGSVDERRKWSREASRWVRRFG